ncbi:hypothetical protein MAR_020218 [Mya arenaria]|uniref:Uncharacterized protein n=1 Tax=Mya arenaria TaxID=6604 RepID=A0ABY7E8X5_MYAAR|nr:hypothetical protein MAR_020218 [Mya arenaria]
MDRNGTDIQAVIGLTDCLLASKAFPKRGFYIFDKTCLVVILETISTVILIKKYRFKMDFICNTKAVYTDMLICKICTFSNGNVYT